MKLWVDDIRVPPDDSWHICRTVLSAVRAMDHFMPEITDINLDHDISHQVVLGKMSRPYPCDETFEAVARYIALLRSLHPEWKPTIRIHTSNPLGADTMFALLNSLDIKIERVIAKGANRLETML